MLKQLKGTRGCCFVSEVCPSNQTVLPVPDKREPEKVSPVHGEQVREATGFGSWSQEILWGECHSEVPWQKSSTWYLKSQNISKYMDLLSKIGKPWWFAFLCAMIIRLFFGSWYFSCGCAHVTFIPVVDSPSSLHRVAICRCVDTLNKDIAEVDKHYDLCNDAWAKGEVDDFTGEKPLGL